MPEHVTPEDTRLAAVMARAAADDGPVVMLNLNRYRDRAQYPPGTPDPDVSGREAYLRYGRVAAQAIAHVGGRILWAADTEEVVIGCDHDRYDEVVAVWYPTLAKFLALEEYPGYRDALEHRDAAIEQATLLPFVGSPEPELRSPFDV